jgi:hypothetical protein
LFTSAAFYLIFGILGALFFGNTTYANATINWSTYTGRYGGWGGALAEREKWAIVVQLVVPPPLFFTDFNLFEIEK